MNRVSSPVMSNRDAWIAPPNEDGRRNTTRLFSPGGATKALPSAGFINDDAHPCRNRNDRIATIFSTFMHFSPWVRTAARRTRKPGPTDPERIRGPTHPSAATASR